nr:hypothetical protein [Tanacetum cinerariifolium]
MDSVVPSVTGNFGNAAMEVESHSMVEETVKKEKLSPVMNTFDLGSYPPLPTQETTSAGNAPGKSSYANVTGKPSSTKVNFCTLFKLGGNGIDVVVPVESIRVISKRFVNTAYGFFLGKRVAYPVVANYKWHPDVNLLKEDVGIVTVWVKLHGVPVTTFSEDSLSVIATKVGKATILVTFVLSMSENLLDVPIVRYLAIFKRNVPRMQKMGFKPKQVYQPVSKKTTANISANKKKNVNPPKEVPNPFEVLTSVENDEELGKNWGDSNLASKATNSSGSSF